MELGAVTETIYVGKAGWDVGDETLTGPAADILDSLMEYSAMGVTHIQVRFRARSLAELEEQMEAFDAGVGVHLVR